MPLWATPQQQSAAPARFAADSIELTNLGHFGQVTSAFDPRNTVSLDVRSTESSAATNSWPREPLKLLARHDRMRSVFLENPFKTARQDPAFHHLTAAMKTQEI